MTMQKRKVTAASVRRDAQGRWLDIFQYMCPGMFDEAIRSLGDHVTCPFHGGVDDFRFVKTGTKKGPSTSSCGVALCTCGIFSDGLNVLERALNCSFSDILKEVDEYLNGSNVAPSHAKPIPQRAVVPLVQPDQGPSDEELLAKRRALWNPASAYDPTTTPYYGCRSIRQSVLRQVRNVRVTPALAFYEKDKETKQVKKVGVFPAILGLMRDADDRPVAIHRTWLSADRRGKAPVVKPKKLSQTNDAAGGAVRLFDADNSADLGLTEGLETALSARQLSEDGYFDGCGPVPVWACYSERNLRNFQIPKMLLGSLKRIIIFADNDERGTGQKAAEETRAILQERYPDLIIEIRVPELAGMDWNDVLVQLNASVQQAA